MLLSGKHRRQNNNASHNSNRPSSSDCVEPAEHHKISPEKTSAPEEDSLVEHILDFLEKYPACFASRTSAAKCLQA
jgi:hypothetical protein